MKTILALIILSFIAIGVSQAETVVEKRLKLTTELTNLEEQEKSYRERMQSEKLRWSALKLEVKEFNERSDAISLRKKNVKDKWNAFFSYSQEVCTNQDVYNPPNIKCLTDDDGDEVEKQVKRLFALFDDFSDYKIATDKLDTKLNADAALLQSRMQRERTNGKETVSLIDENSMAQNKIKQRIDQLPKGVIYKATPQLVSKLKEFRELQADLSEMQNLGNIIIAFAPLRNLAGGGGPDAAVEIATEDWALLAKASQSLSSHYRDQLKFFCQAEALSSSNSSSEKRFWTEMAKQF